MSDKFRVVEAENVLAVHALTWSEARAVAWCENTGAKHFPGVRFAVQQKIRGEYASLYTVSPAAVKT